MRNRLDRISLSSSAQFECTVFTTLKYVFFCFSVTAKKCDVDNGGCEHFCVLLEPRGTECQCASGYKLTEDGFKCEAIGDLFTSFVPIAPKTSQRATFILKASHIQYYMPKYQKWHLERHCKHNFSASKTFQKKNMFVFLYALPVKFPCGRASKTATKTFASGPTSATNTSAQSSNRTIKSTSNILQPDNQTIPTDSKQTEGKILPSRVKLPKWIFAEYLTSPTVSAPKSRIVGGNAALPGEIPWQVKTVKFRCFNSLKM